MKSQGVFFLSLKEGIREGFVQSDLPGFRKYVAEYTDKELRKVLELHFTVEFFYRTTTNRKYLNYLLRKKSSI